MTAQIRVVGCLAEQIALWVVGESVHVTTSRGNECCPDFSCCRPELQQPETVRREFATTTPERRNALLGTFLAAFIANAKETGELSQELNVEIVTEGKLAMKVSKN